MGAPGRRPVAAPSRAVEEWLRYDGPSGALARVAAADVEIGGKTIREGQLVFAFMNSANRDPEAFDDPDRFDIGRAQNPHLTFGHGIHFCLGAPLARLEAQIAAMRLAERLPQSGSGRRARMAQFADPARREAPAGDAL